MQEKHKACFSSREPANKGGGLVESRRHGTTGKVKVGVVEKLLSQRQNEVPQNRSPDGVFNRHACGSLNSLSPPA
jgi:hypothetical protein